MTSEPTGCRASAAGRQPLLSKLRNGARLACAISHLGDLAFRKEAEFPAERPEKRRELSRRSQKFGGKPRARVRPRSRLREKQKSTNQSQFR
jgi:hypothetical protein